jgi:hypothetical protein
MKKIYIYIIFCFLYQFAQSNTIEKTFLFPEYHVQLKGSFHHLDLPGTQLTGLPGEPLLPWKNVSMLLPPGEAVSSVEIIRENPVTAPGLISLWPAQPVRPTSFSDTGSFFFNRLTYDKPGPYPARCNTRWSVQYLHGYALAFTSFTPVEYLPSEKKLKVYQRVTVRIHTSPASGDHPDHVGPASASILQTVRQMVSNPDMTGRYSPGDLPMENYQYLIVTPLVFKNEFQSLVNLYAAKGLNTRVITVDSIQAVTTGFDKPEKIRNFIINQYNNHQIQYVLLAGNPALVPCRYLHCSVISGGTYYDSIPSDLYYSGVDGTFDFNNNHKYGEIADSADLLPELSVGRFPVNDTAELRKMIRKTIAYQVNPVLGEFSKPLMLGEHLYSNPMTFGSDYMELLIGDHNDNGYFTHGIPPAENQISKMYDTLISPPGNIWRWTATQLLAKLNQGNSFIHHLGHANSSYMLRLSIGTITNANFSQINGIIHNYQLLYTQGCDDGAFDVACIAAKAVKIDNFLVAGIFNSRYGWFNQGTTDGPSQHLQREFVSALYHDTVPEKHIGTAHAISKIKTAPFVGLSGEFEPGAQRWCHFGCNLLGDPALSVWTAEPSDFLNFTWTGTVDSNWQNPANWNFGLIPGSVCNVNIPLTLHQPEISSSGSFVCRDLNIGSNATLTISPGKSLTAHGSVIMSPD